MHSNAYDFFIRGQAKLNEAQVESKFEGVNLLTPTDLHRFESVLGQGIQGII